MNLDNFTVTLAPTLQDAQSLEQHDFTVEAEYGDACVDGKELTLAHHGPRSDNPAPCNWEVEARESGTILVSHIDLDTVGGVLAITGDKIEDPEFWKGAEHIDVNGPHRIHDLSPEVQEKLNAVYAWNTAQERVRYEGPTDVREPVKNWATHLEKVLDRNHPEHEQVIEAGRQWERDITHQTEERCVFENKYVRGFETDGVFCASAYYSPTQQEVIPCTVSFNENMRAVTVAFADGGKEFSAREIVQELWGPEAGGRDGIAGSPRGRAMTREDFKQCLNACMDKMQEREQQHEVDTPDKSKEIESPKR